MDRTSVQIIVHDCHPNEALVVLDLIEEHDLDAPQGARTPDGGWCPIPDRAFALNVTYQNHDGVVGWADETAAMLTTCAPSAAWTLWEDPTGGWPGTMHRHVPGLGVWTATCTEAGEAVFTAEEVRKALQDSAFGGDGVAALLGTRWDAATAALTTLAPFTLAEPRRYEAEWDHRRGEIRIEGAGPPDDGDLTIPTLLDPPALPRVLAAHGFVEVPGSMAIGRWVNTLEVYRTTAVSVS